MPSSCHTSFSYEELTTLVNHIPDPVFLTEVKKDGSLLIVEANKACVDSMKYTKKELLTMSPLDLVEKNFLRKVSLNPSQLKEGKIVQMDSIHVTKEGEQFPVSVKMKQVTFDQTSTFVITLFHDISLQHHTEALLESTHQQLEALFDYNPDLIFMLDVGGNFTNTNPANERILKYTKEEMLSKNYVDVVYPEDLEVTNHHFQLVMNKQIMQLELRVLDKDQNILTLDVTAVPVVTKEKVTGVIGIARDISTEKRMAKELQESEQRYRSIYENNVDAVMSFDLDGNFTHVNKTTQKITGFTDDELIGSNFLPHIVDSKQAYTIGEFKKVLSGEAVQYETAIYNKRKEKVYLHITVIPIIVADKITGVHCIAKDITEKKQLDKKLKYMAYHDSLTDLPNQHYFHIRLREALDSAKESQSQFAVFFLDLDRFKSVNDSLGHEFGDILLQKVANRLTDNLAENTSVFRYGGDEFIVLIEQTDKQKISAIASKLMASLIQPYDLDGMDIVTPPSIGISMFPNDGEDSKTLIKKADNAMYHAKRTGKSNYQFFYDSMHSKIQGNIELESFLRKAIDRKEFVLFYQPQIDTKTKRLYGAEALIRWNNKKLGMISPGEFIPLAEESGLIVPIGEWVIREACLQVKRWQEAGFPSFPVSVNLSIRQFYQTDLIPTVRTIIEEVGIDPSYLELEITESMAMDADMACVILEELKKIGVNIAMDDFGTGYSSLSYLKKFPIDHLKIDQTFINDISTDVDDRDIIATIILLAHNLNMVTIAEGVETEEHVSFLKSHQCDVLQGYHFSKPLPPKEFEEWLLNWSDK